MKDTKVESLKKRTFGDSICTILFAVIAGIIAVTEFISYSSSNGEYTTHLSNSIYAIIICIALSLIGFVLFDVKKNEKPFSKKVIVILRILAVFIMIGSFLPDIILQIANSTSSQIVIELSLNAKNVLIGFLGIIIGILSEVFVYGYELQNDMDSIA